MAFQRVPNTASAEIRFDNNGVAAENVFHFSRTSAPTLAQVSDLANAIDGWVNDTWKPLMANLTVYKEVHVRSLNAETDVQATNSDHAGTAGTGGASLTNNVTKAFTLSSGMTGRNARGRMFFVGAPRDQLSGENHFASTWVEDVKDALKALKLIVEALGWIWVIVSRHVDGTLRAEALTYELSDIIVTNLTTDSMRSRLPTS